MSSYPRPVWAVVVAVIFGAYVVAGVADHFFIHFFAGTSVGLLIVLHHTINRQPLTEQAWDIPFYGWLVAAFPDLLHTLGYENHPGWWVDLFLLHNSIHRIENVGIWLGLVTLIELGLLWRLIPRTRRRIDA